MQITAPKFRYSNIASDDLWNDEKQARHPYCIKVGAAKVRSTEKKPVWSSVLLLVIAFKTLLLTAWPTPLSIEWSIWFLYVLIGVNILYLINRGVAWAGHRENHNSNT